jgi:hypothetical protein
VRPGVAAALAVASLARVAAAYGPETNYTLHCQGCHLADGTGMPGKIPPLAGGALGPFLRVPGGRAFLARVPGVANAPLGDADLAALLDWTIDHFAAADRPADFAPYTAEEIGRLRASPLVDVGAERRRLLDAAAAAKAAR